MSAASFPAHGDEPEGSVPLPAGGEDRDEEEGARQGLYVTLPAEELTLGGFAEDGRAGTMTPGARCSPRSCPPWPGRTARAWRGCPMTS